MKCIYIEDPKDLFKYTLNFLVRSNWGVHEPFRRPSELVFEVNIFKENFFIFFQIRCLTTIDDDILCRYFLLYCFFSFLHFGHRFDIWIFSHRNLYKSCSPGFKNSCCLVNPNRFSIISLCWILYFRFNESFFCYSLLPLCMLIVSLLINSLAERLGRLKYTIFLEILKVSLKVSMGPF